MLGKFLFHLLIVSLASDATVRIWHGSTGQHISTLEGHLEGISDISWAPDSQVLASASDDKTIRVWNVLTVSLSWVILNCIVFVFY